MRNVRMSSISGAILFLLVSNGWGQNTLPQAESIVPAHVTDMPHTPDVPISSGDLLSINVDGAPEYRYDVRVSSAGDASLPMIGNIKLAGLSTSQAANSIAQSLQLHGFFNNPQVSIFVKEYATGGISILGEVQHPGIYPLLGHRTLLDAISAAGGTTPTAGKSVTITERGQPGTSETVILSYDADNPTKNMMIRPGDTIVVSRAGMVYVVGDVKEPTGIIMANPRLTVLQAIAMAHGTNPTAKLKSVKLIRKTDGDPQEFPIPLDMILAAKEPDLMLKPNDIVFVPNSVAKTVTRRGLEAALQAATGLAIYGRY